MMFKSNLISSKIQKCPRGQLGLNVSLFQLWSIFYILQISLPFAIVLSDLVAVVIGSNLTIIRWALSKCQVAGYLIRNDVSLSHGTQCSIFIGAPRASLTKSKGWTATHSRRPNLVGFAMRYTLTLRNINSHNVTHSLISRNPREQRLVVVTLLSLI